MTEQLPDEPLEQHGPDHYVALIRRRQLVFLIPLFVGWLLVWSASWVLPRALHLGHTDSGRER